MIDYANLKHHYLSEQVVEAICQKIGTKEKSFFRTHVAYYMAVVASMMRTNIQVPGSNPEPVNMFAVNLAPSGFGKGYSTSIIEENVIKQFQVPFIENTFPIMANVNLPKLAAKYAAQKQTEYDEELLKIEKAFASHGTFMFSFDSATAPAVKQMRNMLLMANVGSMNLQTDEIGSNLSSNMEIMMLFCELYNGKVKNKLVKNTTDSIRTAEIQGITPTNMMLFGEPGGLLDGGKTEEEFTSLLSKGYARRCFFGFVPEDFKEDIELLSPEEQLKNAKSGISDAALEAVATHIGNLVNPVNTHKMLIVPDDTAKLTFEYKNDCAKRAHEMKDHETIRKTEMRQRFFKALKLSGAYAFIDQTPEITKDQYLSAVAIAEESGISFERILNRDRVYVKFAKYIAKIGEEVTQADLIEDLPFYRGTKTQKEELITQAIAWGYKNNIIIKKRFTDGIEFLRGETLTATDLNKIAISYSDDIADNYISERQPFNKLHKLTQADGIHWTNHLLTNGHRSDEFCIPGFNIVVIDVDDGLSLKMAKSLLKDYKALYYTTKRHTQENNRFRIIFPTNYELKLDANDFKEFMKNLFEWLPFDSDTSTGQRSRKWLSNKGHYEYTDGAVLDVLPFIPKTTKNEERKRRFNDLHSLDNLERWVLQNTGDGNRNNQLLKYAYVLVDGGYNYPDIQRLVLAMNDKLADKLEESEILSTIMSTISKAVIKRNS